MKFIEFAGQTINFALVAKIGIEKNDCGAGKDTERNSRPYVWIRLTTDGTLPEHYDTLALCQERFDGLMRALNK